MTRFSLLFFVCGFIMLLLLPPHDDRATAENVAVASSLDHKIYLPAIFNWYDPQFPAPLFGMQVYGSTEETGTYYSHLIDSQTSWARVGISWSDAEPVNEEPANYLWDKADRALSVARSDAGGLHLIVTIDRLPSWARLTGHPNGPINSDSLDDFGEFVGAVVERYDGDGYEDAPGSPIVRHWEFINEPDLNARWGYYGLNYASMLEIAYPAVKQSNNSSQVLFGGIAYDWFESQGGAFVEHFLDDVLTSGGGAYFDVMNFHVYPLFEPNWGGGSTGLIGKTTAIRTKLAEYGLEKPIVITETGWYTTDADTIPGSSDEEQVPRLVQLITQSFAADVKVMIWWMLWDPGNFLADYGLVTNASPPLPKDAYTAYQTAVSLLNNTRSARQLNDTETGNSSMEAYRLTGNATIYTAWMNPYGTAVVEPLQIPATSATVLDGLGNTVSTAVDHDGDGYVTIAIASEPIYIQVSHE